MTVFTKPPTIDVVGSSWPAFGISERDCGVEAARTYACHADVTRQLGKQTHERLPPILNAMDSNADELAALLARVEQHCQERRLTIFRGYINPEEHQVVDWDDSAGDLWVFLETASSIGARMLYVHAFPFSGGELEEALEPLDGEDASLPPDGARGKQLEAYRARIGSLSMMTVMYRFEGVFHAWSKTPSWYDEFLSLRDQDEHAAEENSDDQDGASQQKEDLLNGVAIALANDPRFPECRNERSRLALLRRIKTDIRDLAPSEHSQLAIVREAQAIFDLDVRPKLRENPRERILALQRQGFTVAQIASRVSLKSSEVQRLLNEEPSTG